MKANFILVAIAAMLLSMTPVSAAPSTTDNTFRFEGTFTLQNPCNNEVVSGPIYINIVVTTTVTGNGETKVNVHHTSHGLLTGNAGNEYQISRVAKGQFDAISGSYVIPWTGQFIGKGDAPNFEADATLRVFVDTNNNPIGSQGMNPVVRTCNSN